ncbi:DUF397 domain-containing protein [Streptomyces sp. ZEA17I]|uniref:DUF397 domain-containing protein n=1 Tax=Streptomyces rhizosphaericola TaxID=2564098 RepID=A0ABY2PH28_9ACTN|nr:MULTISPECIES: DUF397 domain-containing protein [Streptomyces]MYT40638.1 DUF397 domain-containing protein [Streptomyces sp. SID8356]PWS43352.1 DUF397 domain-containing protein [Streptomyces sp. ZEA17I]TGZ09839.1 DUF397 domain-containing protein [Streptomyces rhizosphaericola]
MVRYGLPDSAWVKSSYSGDNGGTCVETQSTPDGRIAVGDSKDRVLGAHTFAPAPWQAFVTAVQDGSL